MKILLVSCILAVAISTQFDITSTSTCTNYASGFCTRWEQNGTVIEQLGSCFPSDTLLMTRLGPKTIDSIEVGEEILTLKNGKEEFSTVTGWFHHDTSVISDYLQLNIQNSKLVVSAKHNLALSQNHYVFADETLSQNLLGFNSQVFSLEHIQAKGKYSPKTINNNYFVILPNGKKVLAHCFAHIRNPQKFEMLLDGVQYLWNTFWPQSSRMLVHPSYTWLHEKFEFLTV